MFSFSYELLKISNQVLMSAETEMADFQVAKIWRKAPTLEIVAFG
jgi:hypothetical protein